MTSVMKAEPTNGRKPSSSTTEHVEANQERQDVFPRQEMELPRCYPNNCRGQPVFSGNPEALAFAIDACSTIVTFVGSGAFLATALLKLAADAAGCAVEPLEEGGEVPDCNETIYGIRPSSLLTTVSTIVGIFSACLMPLVGAIVDTTSRRRLLGRLVNVIFCSAIFSGIFISEESWFPLSIIQVIMGFTSWFQTMVTYSYLPELTNDETVLNEYTRSFAALSYTSMVLYLAAIIGVTGGLGYMNVDENTQSLDDEIMTARIAQSVSFIICTVGLTIAWGFLFQKRPPTKILGDDESVWTYGFRQVARTSVKIYKHYPRLKWFYISIAFCDSALMALTVLSITYLTEQLDFDPQENGIALLAMLICAVPGSFLGSWVTSRFDAIWSSMGAVTVLIVNTVLVAIFLKGPGQQLETYILAGGWGVGTGWKWTCDRMVLVLLIPPGQNSELMGMFVFFRLVIGWLPPLVFTILNEKGVSLRIAIGSLAVYFVIGLFAYWRIVANKSPAVVANHQSSAPEQIASDDEEQNNQSKSEQNSGLEQQQLVAVATIHNSSETSAL